MKQRMSAAEAGRKGGASRSAKKLAAARRNGFQKAELRDLVTYLESDDFAASGKEVYVEIVEAGSKPPFATKQEPK